MIVLKILKYKITSQYNTDDKVDDTYQCADAIMLMLLCYIYLRKFTSEPGLVGCLGCNILIPCPVSPPNNYDNNHLSTYNSSEASQAKPTANKASPLSTVNIIAWFSPLILGRDKRFLASQATF